MLEVKRIGKGNWLFQAKGFMAIMSVLKDGHNLHFTLGEVVANNNKTYSVKDEIWSSTVMSVQPYQTTEQIIATYRQCVHYDYPIEMVYLWGGKIRNDEVKVAIYHDGYLQ